MSISYKGIASRRFEYLLQWGIEPRLVKLFLKEKKLKLTLSGAKADNLPSDYLKQVKFIATLPEKAHEDVKQWFSPYLEKIPDEPAEQIVSRFLLAECGVRDMLADERTSGARTLLRLLLDDVTPQLVLDYLKTPLSARHESALAPQSCASYPSESDVEELVDVILDKFDEDSPTSNPATVLVAALIQAKEGNNAGRGERLKQRLKSALPHVAEKIDRVLGSINAQVSAERARPLGMLISDPLTRNSVDEIDPETVDVVGYCKNILDNGTCFIRVIGLREGQDLVELSDDQAKQIFPESGEFMSFPESGQELEPQVKGELGIWRLQKKDTWETRKIRFQAVASVDAVYDVVIVPYNSFEPDEIRAWLKKRYAGQKAVKPIFQLQDGLLVKPSVETTDFERLDYERPFEAWETLAAVRFRSRLLVLRLPPYEREWECPPIASAIKKILKSHGEEEMFPELTKRHIQHLCQKVEHDLGKKAVSARLERVQKELGALADQREVAGEIVSALINISSVRKEIEEAKDKIVRDYLQSKTDLARDLEKLHQQKVAVVKDIAQKKEEVKRQSAEVTKSIKRAFETAKAAGVESLGQLALFQAFLTPSELLTSHSIQGSTAVSNASRLLVTKTAGVKGSLAERLISAGLSKGVARRWELALEISARVGFVITFCGAFASLVAREIAVAVTQHTVLSIDIPVGLVDGVELDNVLHQDGNVGAFLLRNVNNSAIEAYAPSLQNIAARGIGLGFRDFSPSIVTSLSNGVSALPLPASFIATSFLFDLDAIEPEEVEEDKDAFIEDMRKRLKLLKRGAPTWLIGLSRLLDEVSQLDSIDRAAVMGLVKQGVVDPFFDSLELNLRTTEIS